MQMTLVQIGEHLASNGATNCDSAGANGQAILTLAENLRRLGGSRACEVAEPVTPAAIAQALRRVPIRLEDPHQPRSLGERINDPRMDKADFEHGIAALRATSA